MFYWPLWFNLQPPPISIFYKETEEKEKKLRIENDDNILAFSTGGRFGLDYGQ